MLLMLASYRESNFCCAEIFLFLSLTLHYFRTPDATLINGLGRYADGPASDLAVITVTQGTR